jgi:hypothetical protein
MATSGSTDYSITRNDIIKYALQEIGVLGVDEIPDASLTSGAVARLNHMTKAWMGDGYNLWASAQVFLFLTKKQAKYNLGSGGDRAVFESDLTKTTTNAIALSGATTFAVDSTSGMTVSDNIGIAADDNTMSWSTISSIGSGTVTVASGVSAGAASGADVYFYNKSAPRPLRIFHMMRRQTNSLDIPMVVSSRTEYWDLPNKTSDGSPTEYFYDPQLNNGMLYIWPTPAIGTDVLIFGAQRPLEDFDSSSDNPDFPIEWSEALIYGLAKRLAGSYNVSDRIMRRVALEAKDSFDLASDFDRENTAVFFQPNERRG